MTSVGRLGLYLHLARASESRRRLLVRDKLLVLAAAMAAEQGLPRIAAHCRRKVIAHNPGHLLSHYPTVDRALQEERFCTLLESLQRQYPQEKAEQMLSALGMDLAREREAYYTDEEYAAAVLGIPAGQLDQADQPVSASSAESSIATSEDDAPDPIFDADPEVALDGRRKLFWLCWGAITAGTVAGLWWWMSR
jgi:hypothetical protein